MGLYSSKARYMYACSNFWLKYLVKFAEITTIWCFMGYESTATMKYEEAKPLSRVVNKQLNHLQSTHGYSIGHMHYYESDY